MRTQVKRFGPRRSENFEATSRMMRWLVLGMVLITFPFGASGEVIILTVLAVTAAYNALRYNRTLHRIGLFKSHINSLAVDHILVLSVVAFTGGLASPYYPLFYLLIIGAIAWYGIPGFAFVLSSQAAIAVLLFSQNLPAVATPPQAQFIINFILVVLFCIVAEQTLTRRDDEYLLDNQVTRGIQAERQRLLSLINSLTNAVLAIDHAGSINLYNAAALDLLNTNRNLKGLPIDELLPLHDKTGQPVKLIDIIPKDSITFNRQDLFYEAPDGSVVSLDLTVTPVDVVGLRRNSTGDYMVVFRDITKQKSLDDERDEFISVTSHELRTPLAIAEANLSTALLPGYAHIDPKAKSLLKQSHANLVFLSELIQDLTTLSRAERNELTVEWQLVDASQLARDLVRDYRPQAEAKGLKLELEQAEGVGSIVTSPPELREILQNLITNAIKYTNSGSVTLSVRRTSAGTEFAVTDTGIGISASDKDKIFTKFYRSEDYRIRESGGTGLGLYITHKLAEKLELAIDFTSRLNHGSTFTVLVPPRPVHAEQAAVSPQEFED